MSLDLPQAPEVEPDAPARGVLRRFESELGELWLDVAPLCAKPCVAEGRAAIPPGSGESLGEHTASHALPPDLQALLVGWRHYGESERAVLRGAVGFVTDANRRSPDDDLVIEAAVRALLRGDR